MNGCLMASYYTNTAGKTLSKLYKKEEEEKLLKLASMVL